MRPFPPGLAWFGRRPPGVAGGVGGAARRTYRTRRDRSSWRPQNTAALPGLRVGRERCAALCYCVSLSREAQRNGERKRDSLLGRDGRGSAETSLPRDNGIGVTEVLPSPRGASVQLDQDQLGLRSEACMECSVCLELPEKRIPARHLSSTCRPRHIYATFVGECTCAMVWCVWCARKAADYRLNQAIRAAAAVHGDDKDDDGDDSEAEMVPCPMCRAPVHPTRFFTHPRPLGGAERARLVREYRPPPCWFIWGDNLCRFGRLCRNSHAGLDGRPLQRGPPLSRQDWLARARLRLPEPFHMPPSFLDRSGRAWFHTERHGYVRIVDPTSPQVWEKLNTAQRFSPMSDKHPTEAGAAGAGALGLGLGGGLALSTGLSLSVSAADLDADGGGWRWLASTS